MAIESFEDYQKLRDLFRGGDVSKASKEELECYAVRLSRPEAHVRIGDVSFPQACETVRTLLIVRMSEEANREATRISKIALGIAVTALAVAVAQLLK